MRVGQTEHSEYRKNFNKNSEHILQEFRNMLYGVTFRRDARRHRHQTLAVGHRPRGSADGNQGALRRAEGQPARGKKDEAGQATRSNSRGYATSYASIPALFAARRTSDGTRSATSAPEMAPPRKSSRRASVSM